MTSQAHPALSAAECAEWLKLDEIWQKDRPYLNITGQMARYKELGYKAAISGMNIKDIRERAKEDHDVS